MQRIRGSKRMRYINLLLLTYLLTYIRPTRPAPENRGLHTSGADEFTREEGSATYIYARLIN